MKINSVQEFLKGHAAEQIKIGQSGAAVYDIDGTCILKHVRRENVESEELFCAYRKEALFYRNADGNQRKFLPKILDIQSSEQELAILMKKYRQPMREEINSGLLRKIMRTLAQIHTGNIPLFLRQNRAEAEPLPEKQIQESLRGWRTVLAEHSGSLEEKPLPEIAEKINAVIRWHGSEEPVLTHGDFHWDNLLMNENGDILICDWQNVSVGGASGEISFLLSRLSADGITVDAQRALSFYAEAVFELTRKPIDLEAVRGHMAAANLITSFQFWHQYLHGSSVERVRGIYDAMRKDFYRLLTYLR